MMELRSIKGLLHWTVLLLVVAVFASGWVLHPVRDTSEFRHSTARAMDSAVPTVPTRPEFSSRFVSSSVDVVAHSASIAPVGDGNLIAAWFAGSREGSPSVSVRGAIFDARTQEWGEEFTLVDRHITESGVARHIRKLGNPVIAMAPDNRLWLFFVSVSVGGWALSSVNAMFSGDFGKTWSVPRRLVTSPFFNISTLVRGVPVFHHDGSIGLPVYHEFAGKFAEYLYLDRNGRVVDKFRISKGRSALQPTVVTLSGTNAVALLRNSGDQSSNVLASRTSDKGRTWTRPRPLLPNNRDSSLAAIAAGGSRNTILVALNNLEFGRHRLSLYETEPNLNTWNRLVDLDLSPDAHGRLIEQRRYRALIREKYLRTAGRRHLGRAEDFLQLLNQRMCRQSGCEFEYEYPNFLRSRDGNYHVVYTWNNSFIKHVTFNQAWLEEAGDP